MTISDFPALSALPAPREPGEARDWQAILSLSPQTRDYYAATAIDHLASIARHRGFERINSPAYLAANVQSLMIRYYRMENQNQ